MTTGATRTRIKICGITSAEAARVAAEAGADAIGLVAVTSSPRSLDDRGAEAIAASLPPFVETVRVFQNAAPEELAAWKGRFLQLHGDEDEGFIADIRQWHPECMIIRGFRFSAEQTLRWAGCRQVHALLVDGSPGGQGEAFDHARLAALMERIGKPVILAGGLTAETVGDAIRAVRPYAVDVSSGTESEPGVKDPRLIRAFCQAVREADRTVY